MKKMEGKKIQVVFCPNCGQESLIDDEEKGIFKCENGSCKHWWQISSY